VRGAYCHSTGAAFGSTWALRTRRKKRIDLLEYIENMDDTVAFVYKEAVLGKHVWMKFPVVPTSEDDDDDDEEEFQFFKGTITRMEVFFPDHDPTKPLEHRHFVYFGDPDDGYYDLTDLEMTGYLKWSEEEVVKEMTNRRVKEIIANGSAKRAAVTPSTPVRSNSASSAAASSVAAHVVTPNVDNNKRPPKRNNGNKHNDNTTKKKKAKVKNEPGSSRSNIADPTNDEINLEEFSHWLKNIHKGSSRPRRENDNQIPTGISESNYRSIMNRVRDLISGRGITYRNWPTDIRFHGNGQRVDLKTDLEALLKAAKNHEDQFGEDKGHGWLLRHPIKKLLLYQQYVQGKRNNREEPEEISSE